MGASAPDIITYIGVPLAVLGVTPIFWLAYRAIVKKLKLLKDIEKANLKDTSTRAELLSGIVEVTLYQYRLETLDRTQNDYWTHDLDRPPHEGSSWSILHWREPYQKIRPVTRRLQYSEPLRLPRAKVDFDSLVMFLLDRGATLRPRQTHSQRDSGFKLLLNNGIRAPVGTRLLFGKNDEPVLEVAAPFDDEFEGLPTLTISRNSIWKSQEHRSLPPPGWLLLRPLAVIEEESSQKVEVVKKEPLLITKKVEEEPSVKNIHVSEENPVRSQLVSSTKAENKISNMHDTSTAPEKDGNTDAYSSAEAPKDISSQEDPPHVDQINIIHTSEETGMHNVQQSVRNNDENVSNESSRSYQFVLGTTSIEKIETRVAFQVPVPMPIPEHLNAWINAAARAYAIQNGSLCRYTVPTGILAFLTSPELLRSPATVDPQLMIRLQPLRNVETEQWRPLLAHVSEGWIEEELEGLASFEQFLEMTNRKFPKLAKYIKVTDQEMRLTYRLPLTYAAVLAWYWLIATKVVGSHLNSAEVTEGLLNEMIADKEEAEYFARCMDSWIHRKPIPDLPPNAQPERNAKYMEKVPRVAKATWLLCFMAKYLSRDDDFRDVGACFVSHPTVLLG